MWPSSQPDHMKTLSTNMLGAALTIKYYNIVYYNAGA